ETVWYVLEYQQIALRAIKNEALPLRPPPSRGRTPDGTEFRPFFFARRKLAGPNDGKHDLGSRLQVTCKGPPCYRSLVFFPRMCRLLRLLSSQSLGGSHAGDRPPWFGVSCWALLALPFWVGAYSSFPG